MPRLKSNVAQGSDEATELLLYIQVELHRVSILEVRLLSVELSLQRCLSG